MHQEFFFHVLHEEGAAVRPRRTVKDGSHSTWTVPKRATGVSHVLYLFIVKYQPYVVAAVHRARAGWCVTICR